MRLVRQADLLALCTTTEAADDELAALARRCGIECFRGHPEDLLDVDPRMRRLFSELISAAAA